MVLRLIWAASLLVLSLHAKPLSVQISAPHAILINADTGAVLYEKECHERAYPASITKIATALYVLEKKGNKLDEIVQASKNAVHLVHSSILDADPSRFQPYQLTHDGTSMGLKGGEVVSVSMLLHGLMMCSGNDAANVLAESLSGDINQFCRELNGFLKEHGIVETQFVNPHGLHQENHWTTAYDMAQITRLALKHPAFREIVKTARYLKPQTNLQQAGYFYQRNKLLKAGPYYYPKAIGVKIGYHSRAGFTLVGAAKHEGRTLIAVVLKCQPNVNAFRDQIKLFDAAFAEKKISRTLYAQESDLFTHRIKGASSDLKAFLKDDVVLEYYPAEEPKYRAEIKWIVKDLPLSAGDFVGHLRLVDEKENVLLEKPIYATNSVSQTVWAMVSDFCWRHKALCLALFLGSQVILLLIYYFKKHQKVRE
ncbi:MAG: D-alanyl-D-alanine carboxypeptidase [Rhabdochlamydiaceae bacterium]|nr:D-alanyl-D-alanine carboxypeptidase [Rhabdochlamydiaceae bacterium]